MISINAWAKSILGTERNTGAIREQMITPRLKKGSELVVNLGTLFKYDLVLNTTRVTWL